MVFDWPKIWKTKQSDSLHIKARNGALIFLLTCVNLQQLKSDWRGDSVLKMQYPAAKHEREDSSRWPNMNMAQ
ncbi:hypothetical protein NBRC116601_28050 [Cognatishimia sp. WU-CL00825]